MVYKRLAAATGGLLALSASTVVSAANISGLPGSSITGTPSAVIDRQSAGYGNLVTAPTTVYDNLDGNLNVAFGSEDLGATFGDDLELSDTGLLSEITFGIANFATNSSPLDTFDIALDFFTFATPTSDPVYVGTVNESIDFTDGGAEAGLAPNTAGLATLTGLEDEGIILGSTDVVVLQTTSNVTGGTNRLGVISLDPISVGDAIPQLYIDADDVNGGQAGFYNLTLDGEPVDFFVSYEIVVTAIPEPGSMGVLGLGGLGLMARRRRT